MPSVNHNEAMYLETIVKDLLQDARSLQEADGMDQEALKQLRRDVLRHRDELCIQIQKVFSTGKQYRAPANYKEDGYLAGFSGEPCEAPTDREIDRAAWTQGWHAGKNDREATLRNGVQNA